MFYGIPIAPVIIAALADIIVGAIWYSPYLFGPMWMEETGIKKFDMVAMRKSLAFKALSALVMAFVLAYFLKTYNAMSTDAGLEIAFLMWLGFIVTTQSARVIFEKTKVLSYAITISYHLISLIVMTMILTTWK